jgi:hypothetical protein
MFQQQRMAHGDRRPHELLHTDASQGRSCGNKNPNLSLKETLKRRSIVRRGANVERVHTSSEKVRPFQGPHHELLDALLGVPKTSCAKEDDDAQSKVADFFLNPRPKSRYNNVLADPMLKEFKHGSQRSVLG